MKSRQSKLDPHEAKLWQWCEVEKLSLAEACERLKQFHQLDVSQGRLSSYLESLRSARMRDQLLNQITSGNQACREMEAQFAKTPAPEIGTLTSLYRVLIMQLATHGQADTDLLKLSAEMMKPVLQALAEERKAKELDLSVQSFRRQTCELFLEWQRNQEAQRIAASPSTHAEKLDQLYRAMFGEERRQLAAPPA